MLEVFGDREITLARELTKKYEEFFRTTLSKAIERYEETPPKGEFVLILRGADAAAVEDEQRASLPSPEELTRKYISMGMKGKEIAKKVAAELKIPSRDAYAIYLSEKDSNDTKEGL